MPNRSMQPPQQVVPNPDPTELTGVAIDRAVDHSMQIMSARLDGMQRAFEIFQNDLTRVPTSLDRAVTGLRELIEARLDGMDKGIVSISDAVSARPEDVRQQITHLRELLTADLEKAVAVSTERFARIDTQFIERDKRTDQLSLADKTAVAAALQAAKEAVGAQNTSNSIAIAKSESSTVESIRQLQTLFNSAIAAVNDKLNDVRSRIDRGDGQSTGNTETRREYREDRGDGRAMMFGLIGAGAGIAALVVSIINLVK